MEFNTKTRTRTGKHAHTEKNNKQRRHFTTKQKRELKRGSHDNSTDPLRHKHKWGGALIPDPLKHPLNDNMHTLQDSKPENTHTLSSPPLASPRTCAQSELGRRHCRSLPTLRPSESLQSGEGTSRRQHTAKTAQQQVAEVPLATVQ